MSENPKMIRRFDQVLSDIDATSPSKEDIEYKPTKLAPIKIQISLVEYFERIFQFKADPWQKHFFGVLQNALENLHIKPCRDIVHAEAQLGKTIGLSNALPAYCMGHEPLFQIALIMNNESLSWSHSQTVIQILNSDVHKDIFPDKDGWLSKAKAPKTGWRTNAREEAFGSQLSFNPCGLQTGVTGSGFHWGIIDDPYASDKQAKSETVNETIRNIYEYTLKNRFGEQTNVTAMFHRYFHEDFAGYLLDTGEYDYIRYASIADGDYVHEATGLKDNAPGAGKIYPDPLRRKEGELISPRRGMDYYLPKMENTKVWLAMNQGRPGSDTGDFFNVKKLTKISPELGKVRESECIAFVRSWDNAGTKDAGAYTVGTLMGIRPNGHLVIFDMVRKQLATESRLALQKKTAEKDGHNVTVTIPNDPGAGGDDAVFLAQQTMSEFNVEDMATSGSKTMRATGFQDNVNTGKVEYVSDEYLPDDEKWNKAMIAEFKKFPNSDFKDITDSASDGNNHLYKILKKGLIVRHYKQNRTLITLDDFLREFPTPDGEKLIPPKWSIYVGAKIHAESSKPNAGVVIARASMNSFLKEHLFILDEYKEIQTEPEHLFNWIDYTLREMCGVDKNEIAIYLHKDSKTFLPLITNKLDFSASLFEEDEFAGLTELNWYLRGKETAHPFHHGEISTNMFGLVKDSDALNNPDKNTPGSLYNLRQEFSTWGYDHQGKPSPIGAVGDCLRMICYSFHTTAEPLTFREELEMLIPDHVKIEPGKPPTLEAQMAYEAAEEFAAEQLKRQKKIDDYGDHYDYDEEEGEYYG